MDGFPEDQYEPHPARDPRFPGKVKVGLGGSPDPTPLISPASVSLENLIITSGIPALTKGFCNQINS